MLKRLTFLVVLIVFAKPAYETARPYIDMILDNQDKIVESVIQPVSEVAKIANESVQPIDSALTEQPGIVKSYEQLVNAVMYHSERFTNTFQIEYKGSTEDLENMLNQVYEDLRIQNEYLYYHIVKRNIEYTYTSKRATISVRHEYLTNYEQERYVNGKVQAIIESMPNNLSIYDQVKYVNDYIVQNTVYGEYSSASPHSAYAVALEGIGVCQGYALLVSKLLTELGIPTIYVVGEVESGSHAWNLVQIDGEWYHLDVTWNDPLPDRGNKVRYDYFLKTDQEMQLDHVWVVDDYPKADVNKL